MRALLLIAMLAGCAGPSSFGPDRTAVITYQDGENSCVTPPALFAYTSRAAVSGSVPLYSAGLSYTRTGTRTYELGERAQFLSSALFRLCELRAQGLITSTQAADLFQMVATDAADLLEVRRK